MVIYEGALVTYEQHVSSDRRQAPTDLEIGPNSLRLIFHLQDQ